MLRECDGLVEAVLVVVSAAVSDQLLVDDCVIEHCVCLLRNISFACQEVVEPNYLDAKARRKSTRSSPTSSSYMRSYVFLYLGLLCKSYAVNKIKVFRRK